MPPKPKLALRLQGHQSFPRSGKAPRAETARRARVSGRRSASPPTTRSRTPRSAHRHRADLVPHHVGADLAERRHPRALPPGRPLHDRRRAPAPQETADRAAGAHSSPHHPPERRQPAEVRRRADQRSPPAADRRAGKRWETSRSSRRRTSPPRRRRRAATGSSHQTCARPSRRRRRAAGHPVADRPSQSSAPPVTDHVEVGAHGEGRQLAAHRARARPSPAPRPTGRSQTRGDLGDELVRSIIRLSPQSQPRPARQPWINPDPSRGRLRSGRARRGSAAMHRRRRCRRPVNPAASRCPPPPSADRHPADVHRALAAHRDRPLPRGDLLEHAAHVGLRGRSAPSRSAPPARTAAARAGPGRPASRTSTPGPARRPRPAPAGPGASTSP